jgi:hypothetical protein
MPNKEYTSTCLLHQHACDVCGGDVRKLTPARSASVSGVSAGVLGEGPRVSRVWVRVSGVGPRVSRVWVRGCLGYNVQYFQMAVACNTL